MRKDEEEVQINSIVGNRPRKSSCNKSLQEVTEKKQTTVQG